MCNAVPKEHFGVDCFNLGASQGSSYKLELFETSATYHMLRYTTFTSAFSLAAVVSRHMFGWHSSHIPAIERD